MSDKNSSSSGFGFGSFASLRKSAQELGAKAAASVSDLNTSIITQNRPDAKPGDVSDEASPAAASMQTTASTTTGGITLKADNVTKEELLDILSKMNKKVKSLSAIRQQLTQQVEAEKEEKARVLALVKDEILNEPPLEDGKDLVVQLQAAWREKEEQTALMLQTLQSEFQKMRVQQQMQVQTGTLTDWQVEVKRLLMEEHNKELDAFKAHIADLENQHETYAAQWQVEKKLLFQQHEHELEQLKQSLGTAASHESIRNGAGGEHNHEKSSEISNGERQATLEQAHKTAQDQSVLADRQAELDKVKAEFDQEKQIMIQQWTEKLEAAVNAAKEAAFADREKTAQLEQQFVELQSKYSQLAVAKQELDTRIDSLHQQIAAKDQLLLAKDQDMHQLKAAQSEDLVAGMTEQQQNVVRLENEVRKLQASLLEKQELLSSTTTELEQAAIRSEEEKARLRAEGAMQSQSLAQENSEKLRLATEQLQRQHQSEKEELVRQLKARHADQLAKAQTELTTQQQKENERKLELQETVERLEKEVRSLQTSVLEKEKLLSSNATEMDKVVTLSKEEITRKEAEWLAQSQAAAKDIEEKTRSKMEQLQRQHQCDKDAWDNQIKTIQQQLSEKEMMVSSKDKELEQAKAEFQQRLAEVKAELSAQQASAANGDEQQTFAVEQLQKQQAKLEQENQKLEEIVKDLKQEGADYERSMAAREIETANQIQAAREEARAELVQAHQQQLQIERGNLTAENNRLTNQLESLQQEVSSVKELLKSKTEELDILQATHAQQLSAVKSDLQVQAAAQLQKEQESMTKENEHLAQKLRELTNLIADKERQLDTKDIELQSVKAFLEDELTKTKTELSHMQSNMMKQAQERQAAFESEKKQLTDQLDDLRKHLANADQQVEARQRELAASEAIFADQLSQIKSKLEAKESDLVALDDRWKAAFMDARKDHQDQIMQMKESHKAELEKMSKENAASLDKLQKEHQEKLSDLRAKAMSEMEQKLKEAKKKAEADVAAFQKEKEDLRVKMAEYADNMTAQFKSKLKAINDKAASEANQAKTEYEEATGKLKAQLRSADMNLTAIKNENEDLRGKLARAREEMQMTVENNSATATSLIDQQERLLKEKAELDTQCKRLEQENKSKSTLLEEMKGKVMSLEESLSRMSEERQEQELKLQAALRQESKLKASQAEVTNMREQLTRLKLEHTKNANLVSRLQAEKDNNERSHGERTALVAMLETQLSEMNDKNADINARLEAALYDLSQKDEVILGKEEQLQQVEKEVVTLKDTAKRMSEALAIAQKSSDSKSNKQVEVLQRELQLVKQQMSKKSSAAQKLFQEREAECASLRKANKALQQEVDKGTLSDRRIFELAEKQSNRESHQAGEIEIRDKVIENLKMALLERDGNLAFFEKHVQEVEGQMEELCRVQRREDVNLDYLKSVVVKYLSLPPGSSERARLLPVLATLLQFNNVDYQTIEEGKHKLSWWGSIAPTPIGGVVSVVTPDFLGTTTSIPPTPTTSGAEVSITTSNNGDANNNRYHKSTSLQF